MKLLEWFLNLFRKPIPEVVKPVIKSLTPQEEQIRWNKYLESCEIRKEKHKHNLHEKATGCMVGLRWNPEQDAYLITLLTDECSLMDLSAATGRPVYGITKRLQKMGLVSTDRHSCYRNFPTDSITPRRVKQMDEQIIAALLHAGWQYNKRNGLYAPKWWSTRKQLRK